MSSEVSGGRRYAELVVNDPHVRCGFNVLFGFRVVLIVVGDEAQKCFEATFLKYPHQTFEEMNASGIN